MSGFDAYCELQGTLEGSVFADEPMARHTSFRIGGPADLYVECASLSDLTTTLATLEKHTLPWAVVGKGSNLLVSDAGFRGAILTLGAGFKEISLPDIAQSQHLIVAGAGVLLSHVVRAAYKGGLSGLEFGIGIPGVLGGALFMNAGTAQEWIGRTVESLTVLRPGQGLVRYKGSEVPWRYRSSGLPAGDIIVECELRVRPSAKKQIELHMENLLARRRNSQPLNKPSAGSTFKNPVDDSAGRMIEALGLKGYTVGGAQVSEKHANFIVNDDGATAADVIAIIEHIRHCVKEEYGTELQPEIRFIGFEG
ncbi:MAG: UDP-N-acetylmuramate dehydrogenase [Coriobacteriales bacterium]|jgi:UDP-N-acetylmuramate dehydrogenase|nr:UDP-N-acetylmuramate dehydrogenase [Coriobacteriales bacterium]